MFAGICCGPRRVRVLNAPVPYPANPEDGAIQCSVPPVAAAHPVLGSRSWVFSACHPSNGLGGTLEVSFLDKLGANMVASIAEFVCVQCW